MAHSTHHIGHAGEHLVASFLYLIADDVFFSNGNSDSDLVFLYKKNYYRVQVKTKSKQEKSRNNWRYDMRKNYQRKSREYDYSNLDFFAFANLKYRSVIFIKPKELTQMTFADEHIKNNDAVKNILDLLDS
tara:strand:- start:780 stop:1172 length:393 start_codon:yes stop_codon:yes gene_type:complete